MPISTGGGKALYVGTYLPADGEYQRVKALLVERYRHRDLEPGSAALDAVDPTPLFDRVARPIRTCPATRRSARSARKTSTTTSGEDPVGYAAMTVRKVWRMWSAGIGEAMSSTAGRVVQVILVLLALAGLAVLGLAAAVVGPGRDGDPDRDRHRRRRRLARGPEAQRGPDDTRVSACRGSPGAGRRSPILLGLMDLVGAGIFPAELTALRSAGLIAAAALVVYALARRHSLRNVDVLILLASGVGLAIVAGTEVTDELLSRLLVRQGQRRRASSASRSSRSSSSSC